MDPCAGIHDGLAPRWKHHIRSRREGVMDAIRWIGPPSQLSAPAVPDVTCSQFGGSDVWECWCRVCNRIVDDPETHDHDEGE